MLGKKGSKEQAGDLVAEGEGLRGEERAVTGGSGSVSEASLSSAQFLSGTSAISLITCRQYSFSTSLSRQISVKRCVLETLLESLPFFISLMFLFTSKFSCMVCLHGKISKDPRE